MLSRFVSVIYAFDKRVYDIIQLTKEQHLPTENEQIPKKKI